MVEIPFWSKIWTRKAVKGYWNWFGIMEFQTIWSKQSDGEKLESPYIYWEK